MAEAIAETPAEAAHPEDIMLQEKDDSPITSTTALDTTNDLSNGEPADKSSLADGFICGVVEGFYGRPWTTEQRKDLFRKLKQWGMDSYIYAPKDDYKHRAYWRELYTVEEADHLTGLITAAHEQGINFYYALSPGLDITYSSSKEVATLKRKLDQVSQFGCKAFALLFDDIEPEMSKADKEVFQSFAYAQVSVTNEIYNHLNCPRFLFCPTQYCSSRAVPTVKQSEYLNTLGSKLVKAIDVLWTGPKVISKLLTVECIEEITDVLKRPPVIWDNLHANDYDQKRVFLGPYSGRSPELIPLLRGVVTNPNCEFHANAIAIQTLAFWSKCSVDTTISSSISSDIKLETENEQGICEGDAPAFLSQNVYHPRLALKNAIANWLPEFFQEKEAWGPITKPQPAVTMVMPIIPIIPSVNTCMTLTSTSTTTTTTSTALPMPEVNPSQLQMFADVCSTVTNVAESLPNPIMNSLVSATKVITNESLPNPVAAAVNNMAIPSTIPISSIPVPMLNMKASDNDDELAECVPGAPSGEGMEKPNTNEGGVEPSVLPGTASPLEGDAVIEDGTDSKPPGEANHHQTPEGTGSEQESKMLELDDNEVKMADACEEPEGDDKMMAMTEEQIPVGPIQQPPADQMVAEDEKTDIVFSSGSPAAAPVVPEPMECGSNLTSPKHQLKTQFDDIIMSETTSTCSGTMQVESSDTSLEMAEDKTAHEKDITAADLTLLCDLFYLPFEHGSKALQLLAEFYWLRNNAYVLCQRTSRAGKQRTASGTSMSSLGGTAAGPSNPSAPDDISEGANGGSVVLDGRDLNQCDAQEWFRRSAAFQSLCQNIFLLTKKIARCANKEMCYDLFSYVWDIASVLSLLSAFVKWLAMGNFPASINSNTQGGYTWFSKGWKETFMSGDQEPWVFRGGLVADLQRLIPLDAGNDLFLYKMPETSAVNLYTMRPYTFSDEAALYEICHRTAQDGDVLQDRPTDSQLEHLLADRYLGPFLTMAPEFCMVIEDHNEQLVGYACAALDTKTFIRNMEQCWIPEMCLKYPLSLLPEGSPGNGTEGNETAPVETPSAAGRTAQMVHDSIQYFHNFQSDYPAAVLSKHPSLLCCRILKEYLMEDETICKRVVTVLLAALRCYGSSGGVHVCISRNDRFLFQFYAKLGFVEIPLTDTDASIYLGRNF